MELFWQQQLARWLPLIGGLVLFLYGGISALLARREGRFAEGPGFAELRAAAGAYARRQCLVVGLFTLGIVIVLLLVSGPIVRGAFLALHVVLGVVLAMSVALIETGAPLWASARDDKLPAAERFNAVFHSHSGLALAAYGLVLVGLGGLCKAYEEPPLLFLGGFCLGVCLPALFWRLAGSAAHSPVTGLATEVAATGTALLAAAWLIGHHHFPDEARAWWLPLDLATVAGLAALLGLFITPAARSPEESSLGLLRGLFIVLVVSGGLGYLLAKSWLDDPKLALPYSVGLVAALILVILVRQRAWHARRDPDADAPAVRAARSPFGPEAAAGVALILTLLVVFAFRLHLHDGRMAGGYGAALCAVGLFAAAPLLLLLALSAGPLRRVHWPTPAADWFAPLAHVPTVAVQAVTVFVLGRLFLEERDLVQAGIDITQSYTFMAFILGAGLPLLLAALHLRATGCARADAEATSGPLGGGRDRRTPELGGGRDRRTPELASLCAGTPLALSHALPVALFTAAIPLLVAFFWRLEALAGFAAGLFLAAVLVVFVSLVSGEDERAVDRPSFAAASAAVGPVLLALSLVALQYAPLLIDATGGLIRATKTLVLGVIVLVAVVWTLLLLWRRRPRPAPAT